MINLDGKVVLITGGTKGLGRGLALGFLHASAAVIICARRTPEHKIAANHRTAAFYPLDVRDAKQSQALIEQIKRDYKRLDVLINNAGGSPFALAAQASPRFSEKIIALNLLAPLHLSQAANRLMQQQESGGSIINIASVSGLRPSPGTAAYGAAKAGLISLTQSLAVEWAPRVRLNCIAAGPILTEQARLHFGTAAGVKAVADTIPMARLAMPEDIAKQCVFLASDSSTYLTGACIEIHGGGERPTFLDAADAN